MAEDKTAQKVDLKSVTAIVSSYVAKNGVAVDQVAGVIAMVHRTLSGLGENAPAALPEPLRPAVPIRRSVQPDYVACLECGFRAKILRRHLRVAHDLDPAEYRVPHPLEIAGGLPAHRTNLYRASLDVGEATRAWPTPSRG
jgi:predicted transcriptional regulator